MGQYYNVFMYDPETEEKFRLIPSELKLMEHSYYTDETVKDAMASLTSYPKRVWWVGDYAEENDFCLMPNDPDPLDVWDVSKQFTPLEFMADKPERFLVNYPKKEYIDLEKYKKCDSYGFAIHPLPILCSVGNGRGGGDYCGKNEILAGRWAGDLIGCVAKPPEGFLDTTEQYEFKEE